MRGKERKVGRGRKEDSKKNLVRLRINAREKVRDRRLKYRK